MDLAMEFDFKEIVQYLESLEVGSKNAVVYLFLYFFSSFNLISISVLCTCTAIYSITNTYTHILTHVPSLSLTLSFRSLR